jgi:hypothetical protein
MKSTIKIIVMVLSLSVIYQFAEAQCSGKVQMSKGFRGCGCHCQKKCVSPADTMTYSHNGWYYGDCSAGACCWIRPEGELPSSEAPTETSLTAIFPNPSHGAATITFTLSQSEKVSLKIFDMNGRLVATAADENFDAGENELIWNSDKVNAGVYFLQFQSEENIQTQKLIVTK